MGKGSAEVAYSDGMRFFLFLILGMIIDVIQIPMGLDCPHRLKHHPELGVVGVGHLRTEPTKVGEMERTTSMFAVYDDVNYSRTCLTSSRSIGF